MLVERVHCVGNDCELVGDTTTRYRVDYVFSYSPMHVRYSPGSLTVDFGVPVECQRFRDDEGGFTYLICAPVIRDHRIDYDSHGLPVVVGLGEY